MYDGWMRDRGDRAHFQVGYSERADAIWTTKAFLSTKRTCCDAKALKMVPKPSSEQADWQDKPRTKIGHIAKKRNVYSVGKRVC